MRIHAADLLHCIAETCAWHVCLASNMCSIGYSSLFHFYLPYRVVMRIKRNSVFRRMQCIHLVIMTIIK